MAKIIIRDAVDIDTVIDPATVNDNNQLINDSAEPVVYSTIDLRHQHLRIFSLLSTSDKEINLREYPDEHVEDMAKQHKWTTPFPKPLQTNHDIYTDCNGRFYDSWYLKHSDLKPKHGYGTLPQGVIDEFVKRGAFAEGTGSTIGMAESNNLDFKRKIIDGTYLTTSQGASTNSLTCNICGHEYRDFSKCHHTRGTSYPIFSEDGKTVIDMKKCVPRTGSLDAIEDSVVNSPANDTSTLMVYDMKKDRVVTMDNIAEYSDIFNVTPKNTNDSNTAKPITNSQEGKNIVADSKANAVSGFTDKQVEIIRQLIAEGKKPTMDDINNVLNGVQTKPTETINNDTNKSDAGGKMKFNIKNATVKRVFKDSLNALNVVDSEKINEFFDELTQENAVEDSTERASALDIAMSIFDFIAENQKAIEPQIENNNDANVVNKPIEGNNEPQADTISKDSEEYKQLVADLESAKQMIADLKGINNQIPNTTEIQNPVTKKAAKNSINDFDF